MTDKDTEIDTDTQDEIAPAPQVVVSPGALLKAAREQLQMTVSDIARKLNLRDHHIENIEADSYDNKISMTFTKGYLKNYAKIVKVPQEQILAAFETQNQTEKHPAKLQSFSRKVAKQASDDRLMMVTYIILGVFVALVVVWWLQQSPEDEKSVLNSLPAAPTTTSLSGTLTPSNGSANDIEDPALSNVENVEQQANDGLDDEDDNMPTPEETTSAAVVETPAQNNLIATATQETATDDDAVDDIVSAETVELVFEFTTDCWINIIDGSGEAIAFGVKAAGRVMPVSGVSPFEVTVCSPEVVNISYAGDAVDLTQFATGRTARFSLPITE
ncbi:DUF4115 domain-containing protein [Alteromonadaceae bacterium BrNp21-10]|nr:DUF4115 domain-containing protein [Alteromonadaceae bacterium BrNp21-10]